jgi:hypothetical protein
MVAQVAVECGCESGQVDCVLMQRLGWSCISRTACLHMGKRWQQPMGVHRSGGSLLTALCACCCCCCALLLCRQEEIKDLEHQMAKLAT